MVVVRVVRGVLPPLGILAGLVLLWLLMLQLIGVPRYVIPGPIEVVRSWAADPSSYGTALEETLIDSGLGWVGGMAVGFLLAVVTTESRLANAMALPWILLLRSVPIVAGAPILTLLFGYRFMTVVLL